MVCMGGGGGGWIMSKDVGVVIRNSVVVLFLPCLVTFFITTCTFNFFSL